MIDWPCCFGPVVKQHIMVGAHGGQNHLYHELGSKEKEEASVSQSSLKACSQ
jgi:hypothetical protein